MCTLHIWCILTNKTHTIKPLSWIYITIIITSIGKPFHKDKENYCIRKLGTVMPYGCKHTYEYISFDKEEIWLITYKPCVFRLMEDTKTWPKKKPIPSSSTFSTKEMSITITKICVLWKKDYIHTVKKQYHQSNVDNENLCKKLILVPFKKFCPNIWHFYTTDYNSTWKYIILNRFYFRILSDVTSL